MELVDGGSVINRVFPVLLSIYVPLLGSSNPAIQQLSQAKLAQKFGCLKYQLKVSKEITNRPGVAGAVLQIPPSLIHWFTVSLSDWVWVPFPSNLQNTINPKPLFLGKWNVYTMFTTCHVSFVTYHMSLVMCHMSCVTCHMSVECLLSTGPTLSS